MHNNETITSWHDCVFEHYICDLDLPKNWVDAHCLRGTVPCIVKRPVPSTYLIVQRDLIVCWRRSMSL